MLKNNNLTRIICLVYILYPSRYLVSAIIDKSHLEISVTNGTVWSSNGHFESYIATFIYLLILYTLITYMVKNGRGIRISRISISIFMLFSLTLVINFREWPYTEVLGVITFLVIFVLFYEKGNAVEVVGSLRQLQKFLMFLVFMFPLFNYSRSFVECTLNKCTFYGKLFTSFFPHENSLAIFLLLGACLFTPLDSRSNRVYFFLHSVGIFLTGSRLIEISYILIIISLSLNNKKRMKMAFISFSCATILYFGLNNPGAFTGRGQIFLIGRSIFLQNPLFGFGWGALAKEHNKTGAITYLVYHEHSGVGELLLRFGLAGATGFLIYFFALLRKSNSKSSTQILLVLAVVIMFTTESTAGFSLQSTVAWVYLLSIVNFVKTKRAELEKKKGIHNE